MGIRVLLRRSSGLKNLRRLETLSVKPLENTYSELPPLGPALSYSADVDLADRLFSLRSTALGSYNTRVIVSSSLASLGEAKRECDWELNGHRTFCPTESAFEVPVPTRLYSYSKSVWLLSSPHLLNGRRNGGTYTYRSGRPVSTASEYRIPNPKRSPDQNLQDNRTPLESNTETKRNVQVTWVHEYVPKSLRPYALLARLDRPIGTWLLAWPCFWSISLAAPPGCLPDPKILGLFGIGAMLLRGAGCTVNDLLDRDIDVQVERTRERPLAAGTLTAFQGLSFLGCQLLLGLGVLLQLNFFSQVLGASSLLLVGTYPLMKRWTYWPQAFLGLTFNWGALLGWAAVHGDLDLSVVLPLYASGISWTLVYDTIYAHQDRDDDLKVGVRSTALRFGVNTRYWLTGFSASCITCLTLAGIDADLGWPFFVGMVASAGHLTWQVHTVNINDRGDCNSKFVANKWFGAIVCTSIIAGKLVS